MEEGRGKEMIRLLTIHVSCSQIEILWLFYNCTDIGLGPAD